MLPITAVGKLGDNCKVERTTNGTPVIKMSVAVTIKNGNEKSTLWLSCSWFGRVAESNYIDYLTKGREVFISGMITSNNVGNNGKAYLNVTLNQATLTSGTKQGQQNAPQGNQNYQQGNQQGYQQNEPQQQRQAPPPPRNQADLDDDLPF